MLDRVFYPNVDDNWDDLLFRQSVLEILQPHHVVLDIGAGAGIVEQMNFKGLAKKVVGIDVDPRVLTNPWIDEGVHGDATRTPFEDATFDVVFCDNVMEHIEEPEAFLREVARILKPGGVFLGKTPNRHHYVALFARLTPFWFHRYYNRLRGRDAEDTFRTCYRLNTKKDVLKYAEPAGLKVDQAVLYEGRPEYLRISPLTYGVGILYERAVRHIRFLQRFSVLLIVRLRRAND